MPQSVLTDVVMLEDSVKREDYRLHTFENVWPYSHIVDPAVLARNGFFYIGDGDSVQCAFCKGVLYRWQPEQKVPELHAKYFKNCEFVRGYDVGNLPIPFIPLNLEESPPTNRSLNAAGTWTHMQVTPMYPDFATEKKRLLTFATWPTTAFITTADLAKAGFFYTGNNDAVMCFYCGGKADGWKNLYNNPWIEHATRFPSCKFVQQLEVRGSTAGSRVSIASLNNAAPNEPFEFDRSEIKMRMDSGKVRILLNMNYSEDLLEQVVQRQLTTYGIDHETSEDLLADAFQYSDEMRIPRQNRGDGRDLR